MKNILIIGANGTIAEEIKKIYKNSNLFLASRNVYEDKNNIRIDLSKIVDIDKLILKYKNIRFDYIFINSGIYVQDDLEKNILVNAYSTYYFIKKMYSYQKDCKFILTSSISILKASLDLNPKKKHYIYRNTKYLQLILFNYFKNIDKNNEYYVFHPGIIVSKLSLSLHNFFVRSVIKLIANKKKNISALISYVVNNKIENNMWVCPSKLFNLHGKPRVKEITKDITYSRQIEEIIKEIEKRI